MPSPGMIRRVTLAGTDVSKESFASIFKVTKIGELGTSLEIASNRCMLRIGDTFLLNVSSYKTSRA
jgi:hypothetical protein